MRKLMLYLCLITPLSIFAESEKGYFIIPKNGNMVAFYNIGSKKISFYNYKNLNRSIARHIRRLSTLKRINRAADDPAGLAVAEKFQAVAREIFRRGMNEEDMVNYIRVAESALAQINSVLKRIRVLTIKASSPIYSKDDRDIVQGEIDLLKQQTRDSLKRTEFNRKKVFKSFRLDLSGINVNKSIQTSIKAVDRALEITIRQRAILGSRQNRSYIKIKGNAVYYSNFLMSEKRIREADFLTETIHYKKNWLLIKVNLNLASGK